MADYRTEEEQIEILKKWWRDNGRSTVAGVGVALVGYFAWSGWQAHRQAGFEAAADLYQQMSTAPADKSGALAEQLRSEYPGSSYAIFAALQLAKTAVTEGKLPQAVEMLEWARAHKPDAALAPMVSLRLAQVQYAQTQHEAALATLDEVKDPGAWKAAIAELRGDIALAQGRVDAARDAYDSALKALDESGAQERRQDVEMKLADLARPAPESSSASAGTGNNS